MVAEEEALARWPLLTLAAVAEATVVALVEVVAAAQVKWLTQVEVPTPTLVV